MKLSFRQIFDNFSEPDDFQDIATYFTLRGQEIKEDILISVQCCNVIKAIYYVGEKLS